jgi:hypothetical protein
MSLVPHVPVAPRTRDSRQDSPHQAAQISQTPEGTSCVQGRRLSSRFLPPILYSEKSGEAFLFGTGDGVSNVLVSRIYSSAFSPIVPGHEDCPRGPHEVLVDIFENIHEDLMRQTAKTVGNISFDKPVAALPGMHNFAQCGMASSPRPKPMRVVTKARLKVGAQ